MYLTTFKKQKKIIQNKMQREIYKIQSTNERVNLGARMRNAIGNVNLPDLDPFILLDEFIGEGSSGFPDHPHRKLFYTLMYFI